MKIKRIVISLILALMCLVFTGCSSYISVYSTKVTNDYYNQGVDLFVSKQDAQMLETNSEGDVKTYLSLLASTCGVSDSTNIVTDKDGNIYLSLSVQTSSVHREEVEKQVEKGFFLNKVHIRFKNPLDRLKKAYYEGISEKPGKGTDTYLVYVILNGEGALKSFADYFNVSSDIADDLTLNFLLKTRSFYSSSAPIEYVLTSKFFKFSTTMKGEDGYITYTRYTANSWPWFVLAIIVGLVVVVVLLLITSKSKQEPILIDKTELERIRTMRKSVPRGAKIIEKQLVSKPGDDKIFTDEDSNEENKNEEK